MAREVAVEVRGDGPGRKFGNLPPGRGRGSSVSSIVCYLIGLSHVDPLKHNLFFGRFLNDELHSVPDIDLDFPREIRERADRAGLRALRARAGGAGLRFLDLQAAQRGARCRQGARHSR